MGKREEQGGGSSTSSNALNQFLHNAFEITHRRLRDSETNRRAYSEGIVTFKKYLWVGSAYLGLNCSSIRRNPGCRLNKQASCLSPSNGLLGDLFTALLLP